MKKIRTKIRHFNYPTQNASSNVFEIFNSDFYLYMSALYFGTRSPEEPQIRMLFLMALK